MRGRYLLLKGEAGIGGCHWKIIAPPLPPLILDKVLCIILPHHVGEVPGTENDESGQVYCMLTSTNIRFTKQKVKMEL